jgi:hypothetical protein
MTRSQGRACYHSRAALTVPSVMLECIADLSGYGAGSVQGRLANCALSALGKDVPPGGKDCQMAEKMGVKKCKDMIIKTILQK